MASREKSPTVVDVARHAGLSVTTVSRVLNQSGYFSLETSEKVSEAVKALGYRPNWNARLLKGKPSQLVGLIIPDLSNVFYTSLANAILLRLRGLGYDMMLFVNEEDSQKDLSYLHILQEKHVDGILYAHPVGGDNSDVVKEMVKRGIPVVEVNRQRNRDALDAVLANNVEGVRQIMTYLIELGHRRIAMIGGSSGTTTGTERERGYRSTLMEAGIELDPDLLKIGTFSREYGEEAAEELLSLENPPSAIFGCSNRIMLGVLATINRQKIRVPQEISLAGFDDTEWLSIWNPPITVVDVAVEEMAQTAVNLLHRRMTGKKKEILKPATYYLGTTLVVRESCRRIEESP